MLAVLVGFPVTKFDKKNDKQKSLFICFLESNHNNTELQAFDINLPTWQAIDAIKTITLLCFNGLWLKTRISTNSWILTQKSYNALKMPYY